MRNMNQTRESCSQECNVTQNNMQNSCNNCNAMQNNMQNAYSRRNVARGNMQKSCDGCNCEDISMKCSDPLRGMPIGIGYVPWQEWGCVYDYAEALSKATIFPSLDLPFYGCIPRSFQTNKGGNA